MLAIPDGVRIFIRPGKTDLRQGINGLSMLAEGVMRQNPFSGNLFVFANKCGRTIKLIYWDRNGFCLWMKKLGNDRFRWPRTGEEARELTRKEFEWLLDGLDLAKLKPFGERKYSSVL
jgi:transposase